MTHRHAYEALDRSLRDVMKVRPSPTANTTTTTVTSTITVTSDTSTLEIMTKVTLRSHIITTQRRDTARFDQTRTPQKD